MWSRSELLQLYDKTCQNNSHLSLFLFKANILWLIELMLLIILYETRLLSCLHIFSSQMICLVAVIDGEILVFVLIAKVGDLYRKHKKADYSCRSFSKLASTTISLTTKLNDDK